jgi:hypothetical protein
MQGRWTNGKLGPPKQAFPPRWLISQTLDYEGIFTSAAAPHFELLVIIGFRATTTGAGGSYSPRCLFVKVFPVFVVPTGANRHYVSYRISAL